MNPLALDTPAATELLRGDEDPPVARVLVVDDNDSVLECFRKALNCRSQPAVPELGELEPLLFGTPCGAACDWAVPGPAFEVDTFTDGELACRHASEARLRARPYAVAFVDMRMPGGWDGLQTIEALWRVDAALQVVICTAYSDHSWSDLLSRLGRSDSLLILRKPFEMIEVQQLARALSLKWQLQRLQEARLAELERKVEARLEDLQRANRTLRMLSRCNEALVRAAREPELLQAVCRHIVSIGGYRLAWVGYARDDEAKSVEPAAHAGSDRDYVDGLHLSWGDDERRRGVGGAAIRTGRPVVARHIATCPAFKPWRSEALARGFRSCIALPLRTQDRVLGTLSIYSEAPDAFDTGETRLLLELANDLAYGIASLRETEMRKRIEQELERQARFDRLTGLANRFTLEARAGQCLAEVRRRGGKAALFFIDLDRLKFVNDTLGHAIGDRVLVEVAQRLTSTVRESDIVARVGGDEFVVFLGDAHAPADVATVAEKLVARLAESSNVEHHEIRAAASIGVSLFPDDGDDVSTLLKNADVAMYSAKALGGNAFRFFAPEMNARMAARYAMEADLRHALECGELSVHYQPQASLTNGVVCGVEALVRWDHPAKGPVPPSEFIALAEDTGLIHPLGDWVIANVCAQWRAWLDAGLDLPPVAVNLSARQFRHDNLVSTIERALAAHGLPPGLLELEITESAVMHDVEEAIATMQRLKALGVRLALDDFGTGYSSLSCLKRFPIDRLKIDQSFVREITTDPDDAAICNAIIGMARSLKLTVIAEGVENEAQMNHLRREHCDEMQGYLLARPLPAGQFPQWLAGNAGLPLPKAEAKQRTVLVVDDEPSVVTLLERTLGRDGYRIITAHSGVEGLQRLSEVEVDVIVSDQCMPGMTGTEFLSRAKELYPDTLRIVLAGYSQLGAVADALHEGTICKFLPKPWVDAQLCARIAEAFRQKEMVDEAQELKHRTEESLKGEDVGDDRARRSCSQQSAVPPTRDGGHQRALP